MNVTKSALVALLALLPVLGHAASEKWARLSGCTLMENDANDGDSFHVKYNGKEFIFRLYFVDACETSEQIPERVREQAKVLGITQSRVIEAGLAAKALTHSQLGGRGFTVVTCWQDARGASRLPRYYAFVLYGSDDEHDLASTLAQNGMVRIYGMPAEPPGPMTAAQFRASLVKLDAAAKAARLGIYGDLAASGTGATGLSAATASRPVSAATAGPLSFLFPARQRDPEVTDNPADDLVSDFAIESAGDAAVTQMEIPEDNFSEIPGWQPSSSQKKSPQSSAPNDSSREEVP